MRTLMLIFAFCSHFAFAQERQEAWMTEAEKYVKTLSHTTHIYSWDHTSKWKKLPNGAEGYLQAEAAKYYGGVIPNYEGPNGVYFATDPFSTREYGGKDWAVIRVRLAAGTKFIDTRSSKPLPTSLYNFVNGKNCRVNSMSALFSLKSQPSSMQRACWEAYTAITRAMNVHFIVKPFYTVQPEYCTTFRAGPYGSDFIGIDMAGMQDFAVFTEKIPASDSDYDERVFIRDYWLWAKNWVLGSGGANLGWAGRFDGTPKDYYVTSAGSFAAPWPNFSAPQMNSSAFKQTVQELFFGCVNKE